MKATAAVVERAEAPFDLQEVEVGDLLPNEVRVDIAAVGICHTDLLAAAGAFPTPLPAVLGHEGAGTVAEVGPGVTHVAAGDRVALTYASCGGCSTCAAGRPTYCHEFFPRNFMAARPDGTSPLSRGGQPLNAPFFGQSSFATQVVADGASVVGIGDRIPFEVVAPFGCGIQTGTGTVINALRPPAGASIAVFGTGGVGLSAVLAAVIVGAFPIVAVDVSASRLELAAELGATHTIDASEGDVVERVTEITRGGADFTVECSGRPEVLRQAVDSLAPAGMCALVGAPPFGVEASIDVNETLAHGRGLRGVVEGESVPGVFLPQLVDLWERGRLPVERMIRTFDFDQINEAAASAHAGDAIKPVLVMGA